jgi:hypothetical protein
MKPWRHKFLLNVMQDPKVHIRLRIRAARHLMRAGLGEAAFPEVPVPLLHGQSFINNEYNQRITEGAS